MSAVEPALAERLGRKQSKKRPVLVGERVGVELEVAGDR